MVEWFCLVIILHIYYHLGLFWHYFTLLLPFGLQDF